MLIDKQQMGANDSKHNTNPHPCCQSFYHRQQLGYWTNPLEIFAMAKSTPLSQQPSSTRTNSAVNVLKYSTPLYKSIAFLAILLLIVCGVSWLGLHQIKEKNLARVELSLQIVVNTTYEALKTWIHHQINDTLVFATHTDVRSWVMKQLSVYRTPNHLTASLSLTHLKRILQPWLDQHDFYDITIVAPDGVCIAALRSETIGTINLLPQQETYLSQVMAGKPQLIMPLKQIAPKEHSLTEPVDIPPAIIVGVPIQDLEGKIVAALVVYINPAFEFNQIVETAQTGSIGSPYVFNRQGYVVAESKYQDQAQRLGLIGPNESTILNLRLKAPPGNLLKGYQLTTPLTELPFTQMVQAAINHGSGQNLIGYPDFRGVPVVGAWLWDPTYNFGLAFEMDKDHAYQFYYLIRRTMVALLSFATILFIAFSYGLIREKHHAQTAHQRYIQGISERRKSEKRFQTLLEASPDGMLFINNAGEIQLVNQQLELLFGYASDELLNQSIMTLISPDTDPRTSITRGSHCPFSNPNSWVRISTYGEFTRMAMSFP